MHNPAVAVGLWNAAWRLTVTGGVGGLVWQSVQACCGNVRGFAEFEAWWQTSHLPATLMCAECGNFTAPMVGPLRTTDQRDAALDAGHAVHGLEAIEQVAFGVAIHVFEQVVGHKAASFTLRRPAGHQVTGGICGS